MSLEDMYRTGAYSHLAPTWHVDESAAKAREILRLIESHGLTPRTICEVGCGAGEVLRQLQLALPDDTEFTGYDISPQAIELAQPRADAHLHFHLGDFTQEDTGSYDMLLVLDVLEHLEDYFSFLRRLRARGMYKL